MPPTLQQGSVVQGKWSNRSWVVEKTLGVGANGSVYGVTSVSARTQEAMKICVDSGVAAFEWGILQALHGVTSAFPEPSCIDDSAQPRALYFYVMEQVDGIPLNEVWPHMSDGELREVLLELGRGMRDLHAAGYGFCDVKPQNILVARHGHPRVRFVDVGGVTPFGRSVRQFTPSSDCAYWGFGPRRSSVSYDLMAVALMITCLEVRPPADTSEWSLTKRNDWMCKTVRRIRRLRLAQTLSAVLDGSIQTALEWNEAVGKNRRTQIRDTHATSSTASKATVPRSHPARRQSAPTKSSRLTVDWSERVMWITLCCAMVSTAGAWAMYLTGL